jgi:hypothetical protein
MFASFLDVEEGKMLFKTHAESSDNFEGNVFFDSAVMTNCPPDLV